MTTGIARSAQAEVLLTRAGSVRVALTLALLIGVTAGCGGSGGGGGLAGREAGASGSSGTPTSGSGGGSGSSAGGPQFDGALSQAAFETTVFPIVRNYCASCHGGSGPGFPHLAHPDAVTAYRAVVDNQKVNLATPASSRLVQRLVRDRHFCWSDCAADGAQMEAAIAQWAAAALIPGSGSGGGGSSGGGGTTTASENRRLADATQAESGRNEQSAIALWRLDEGSGTLAGDRSGVGPSMDLTLTGDVEWLSGGGLDFQGGRASARREDSRKLHNEIASGSGTQQYSIEAWVVPANTTQEGPARIITYSDGTQNRNFMMGQVLYNYVFRNRSLAAGIGANGTPALTTADADEDLQAVLQHVVMTFDQNAGRRIHVNGVFTDDEDASGPGMLVNWNTEYIFVLGNETSNNRPWRGQIKLAAIYNRALSASQIMQNYLAGASQKFALRFGLQDSLGAGAYIEFEVSEYDPYSYLFCAPVLVSPNPNGFAVEGLRVAVNGVAPVASQSFRNVRVTVDESREALSGLCSVVPKDLGAAMDEFQIFFEVLASNQNRVIEDPPVPPPVVDSGEMMPDSGVRDFAQINDTMAALTGVSALSTQTTFAELEQQLPGTADLRSFVSSHQVAISKLALEYCDQLVESQSLRTAFFGSQFAFDSATPTALPDQARRDLIIDPLIDRMLGVNLASQPAPAEVRPLLNVLLDDLTVGCTAATCGADRTRNVVKGLCAAVLSSAAAQLQ